MDPSSSEMTYDLAVIGGGIAGVAVARDAALRGLSVVVLEKNTLGSGTSSKSSKLIHGGIRYLELAWIALLRLDFIGAFKQFRFVLSSLRESRILGRMPHSPIEPIRLFIPVYRGRERRPGAVFTGARLYGWLSQLMGNDAAVRTFDAAAARAALPLLAPADLVGGIEIADYTTNDLTLVRAVAQSAQRAGAEIFEHRPALNWKREKESFEIATENGIVRSRAVVNAAGPWIDRLRAAAGGASPRYVVPVGGSHIELPAFLGRSVILEARDGRVFFVLEKNNRARVGTTEWPCEDPDTAAVPQADVDYLLASLSSYFPSKKWTEADVLSRDAGVRPLAVDAGALEPNRVSREHAVRLDADGVLHLVGVKLTDHRRAAEETVDRVMRALGKKGKSRTAVTKLA